jgi:hypothetical protein
VGWTIDSEGYNKTVFAVNVVPGDVFSFPSVIKVKNVGNGSDTLYVSVNITSFEASISSLGKSVDGNIIVDIKLYSGSMQLGTLTASIPVSGGNLGTPSWTWTRSGNEVSLAPGAMMNIGMKVFVGADNLDLMKALTDYPANTTNNGLGLFYFIGDVIAHT